MAITNIDAAFGLKPIRHFNGNPWNGAVQICYIDDGVTDNVFVGDPVQYSGDGADATGMYPSIVHSTVTDGGKILGVVTGFVNVKTVDIGAFADDLSVNYGPASTKRFAEVCIDPKVVFIIQDDGGAVLAIDNVGLNAVGIGTLASAGSTTTGLSGLELDAGTTTAPSANASNPFTIIALHDKPGNELGVNAIWEVFINMHTLRSTGDGDGTLGI